MQRTVKIFLYETRISIFSFHFSRTSHQVFSSRDEEMSPHSRRPEQKYTVVEKKRSFWPFFLVLTSCHTFQQWLEDIMAFRCCLLTAFFTTASTPPCYHSFFFPLSADSFVTVTQVHCGQTEGEKIDTLTPRTGLKISATAKEIESSLFLNSSRFERDKLICHEKDTFCSSRLRFNTWNCKDGEILRVLVLSPISAGDYTSELQWFSH